MPTTRAAPTLTFATSCAQRVVFGRYLVLAPLCDLCSCKYPYTANPPGAQTQTELRVEYILTIFACWVDELVSSSSLFFYFFPLFSLLLLQLSTNRCLLSSFPRISLPIQFIRWRCKAKEPLPHLFPRSRALSNFWLSPNPLRDANDSLPRQRHQALKYPAEEQSSDISRFTHRSTQLVNFFVLFLQKSTSTGPWNRTGLKSHKSPFARVSPELHFYIRFPTPL
ncbi:hypothetical protein V8C43DRAFT_117197 [Trichoderma afarasin]